MNETAYAKRVAVARMCLAEVGVDPGDVFEDPERLGLRFEPWVPDRIAWRAATLSRLAIGDGVSACFACGLAAAWLRDAEHAEAVARCLAALPLTEDCGVDR